MKGKKDISWLEMVEEAKSKETETSETYKLFHVEGARHDAVVLARDKEEAERLVLEASRVDEGEEDSRVLYGYVGDWEMGVSTELRLPPGFKLVKEEE
ncbi:hypothetical protein HYV21_02465 [Candidatus Microgenomates bacterium]|nr:hypothetical protein [Candidatus Microgenomates bacterium]